MEPSCRCFLRAMSRGISFYFTGDEVVYGGKPSQIAAATDLGAPASSALAESRRGSDLTPKSLLEFHQKQPKPALV